MVIYMTVADRIKQLRESMDLTQEELAKKMGYASKSAVSRTENAGDNIGQKRIYEFAKALNCSPSYLLGWTDEVADNEKISINDNLTLEEHELIKAWRISSDQTREMITRIIAFDKLQDN